MDLFESEETMISFLNSLPKSKQEELEKQWQSYIGMYGTLNKITFAPEPKHKVPVMPKFKP